MDEGSLRNFRGSKRSWLLIIPLSTLLLLSLSWNSWQYQLAASQRRQTAIAKRAAIAKENQAKRDAEHRRLKNAENAKSDERVQQLYREINNLTRINERVQMPRSSSPREPAKTDNPKTDDLDQAVSFPYP